MRLSTEGRGGGGGSELHGSCCTSWPDATQSAEVVPPCIMLDQCFISLPEFQQKTRHDLLAKFAGRFTLFSSGLSFDDSATQIECAKLPFQTSNNGGCIDDIFTIFSCPGIDGVSLFFVF